MPGSELRNMRQGIIYIKKTQYFGESGGGA